jgi:hypothetical protein
MARDDSVGGDPPGHIQKHDQIGLDQQWLQPTQVRAFGDPCVICRNFCQYLGGGCLEWFSTVYTAV